MSWEKKFDVMILGANWKEFAKFYSLDVKYCLWFSYLQDSQSQFKVVIHDQDGLEIGYPSLLKRIGEESDQRKKGKSSKKMKFNPKEDPKCCHMKHEGTDSLRTKLEINTKHKNAVEIQDSCYARGECSKSEALKKEEPLEDTKISSALQRAKASKSSNDTIREFCKSHIKNKVMTMPVKFIPAPLQKEGEGNVTLWVSEDSWVVRFKKIQCRNQILLNSGWEKFAEDNDLKVHDVCVFKEMNSAEGSYRVQIFRAGEASSPHQILEAEGRKQRGLPEIERGSGGTVKNCPRTNVLDYGLLTTDSEFPRNNNTKPENQFTITLKMAEIHGMRIPMEFVRKYVTNWSYCPLVLRFKEKDWTASLYYSPVEYSMVMDWSIFVNRSELKDGDECHFELVDEEKMVLEVKVTRRMHGVVNHL
ncbi:B3 domain-containing protein REM16-like [Lotus japonicus]|uniref:B3 domain-containing protein REM16-like n=1 Tax=Lotus japonicus TaxID=34305 RepID=UPI00258A373F|nr:B3 domain-containing protein REM16-like [Lotus japonicus]